MNSPIRNSLTSLGKFLRNRFIDVSSSERLAQRDTAQHSATQRNTAQHSATQRNTARHSATQRDTAQHSAQRSGCLHALCALSDTAVAADFAVLTAFDNKDSSKQS
jgi:hypothetical protein